MNLPKSHHRGCFFVLDGIDGCGKSTQAGLLAHALRQRSDRPVHHLREPGSTRLGESLRGLLLERGMSMGAGVETLLFAAARAQMLEELVEPALVRGEHVVCERFHASTFAYQAVAGGLGEERVLRVLRDFAGQPKPDRVLWLDLPLAVALARRGHNRDRIEDKGSAFQQSVANGYARYAQLDPAVRRIDAELASEQVHAAVLAEVQVVLP